MRVLLCGLGTVLSNALDYRLRKHGCRISKASDGREALHRIHTKNTDVLVCYVNIEGFNLETFISLIRQDFKSDIPIILVAEPDTEIEDVLVGIEAGADDFVTFPFKPIELVMRIKLLVHRVIPVLKY
jgi:DNA-binding response OmpR family regulator